MIVLSLCETWGVPPWEIENNCSQRWLEWATDYYGEKAKLAEDTAKIRR